MMELYPDGSCSRPVSLRLKHPLDEAFTATPRGGSAPSNVLDLLGYRRGSEYGVGHTMGYARIRLKLKRSGKPKFGDADKDTRPSSPPDPEVEKKNVVAHEAAKLYNAARQAERGGLDDLARTLYERLIERYPGSPLAEKARERLER